VTCIRTRAHPPCCTYACYTLTEVCTHACICWACGCMGMGMAMVMCTYMRVVLWLLRAPIGLFAPALRTTASSDAPPNVSSPPPPEQVVVNGLHVAEMGDGAYLGEISALELGGDSGHPSGAATASVCRRSMWLL
jgi:hypothetical protein